MKENHDNNNNNKIHLLFVVYEIQQWYIPTHKSANKTQKNRRKWKWNEKRVIYLNNKNAIKILCW